MLDLRRVMSRIRRRILPRSSKQQTFFKGLPENLHIDLINTLCVNYYGRQLASATYQHLSMWKAAGAYRLFLKLQGGKEVTLIYKLASYTHDEIPALKDLPVQPGHPEYVVLSQNDASLAPFLPKVFLAEEVLPRQLYRYILEDLGTDYHLPVSYDERMRTIYLLPELHHALDDWAARKKPEGLLQYGWQFSRALYSYAWEKLEQFMNHMEHPTIRKILDLRVDIGQLLTPPELDNTLPRHLIHGDSNYSNIHIHNKNANHIKLVDWEWAGYGQPYSDLISLIKNVSKVQEQEAFQNYHLRQPGPQQWRMFQLCSLERGLMDASFLSVQLLADGDHLYSHYSRSIESSLQRVLNAYQQLSF